MDKTNIEYVLPEEIEMRSFEIIAAELAERGITLPAEQDMITRRVIHTSADFDYAETMTYSENAVEIAKNLIKNGADIVTDTNMALAGINKKVLASFGGEAHCYMADAEVAAMAASISNALIGRVHFVLSSSRERSSRLLVLRNSKS